MWTIARYQAKQLIIPLSVWLGFLFLLLFVMQFLRGADVVLGSAVTAGDILKLLSCLAPHFLVMAAPVAFLLSILLGMGRLSDDRELIALHSLGVSPAQLLVVPVAIGLSLGVIIVGLAFTLEPWGLSEVKSVANDVIKRNVVGDVKPGIFYEDLSQLTLYAERVDAQSGAWERVMIHDDRDPNAPLLVLTQGAQVDPVVPGEALKLYLQSGRVHRADRSSSDYTVVSFDRAEIAVGLEEPIFNKNKFRSLKEEMTPSELLDAAKEAESKGGDAASYRVAFHSRIAQTISPIAFALVGTPLSMSRRRGARARGTLLTLGGYVGYYVLARAFDNLAVQGRVPFWLAAQVPNLIFFALGLFALRAVGGVGRWSWL